MMLEQRQRASEKNRINYAPRFVILFMDIEKRFKGGELCRAAVLHSPLNDCLTFSRCRLVAERSFLRTGSLNN